MPRERFNIFLICGSSILFFLFVSILLSAFGFLFRIPLTPYHFFISAILTLIFAPAGCFTFPGRNRFLDSLIVLMLWASSFYLALVISSSFFDISYDGQAYHQEALIQLNRGWNPFYEQLHSRQSNNMAYWLNHYSKGVWIYVTMVFRVTGNIESGKLFHLWLMFAAFLLTLSFLLRFQTLPRFLAFLTSVLVAFNPVSVYQSLSFYLDGQLMSLMVILAAVLGLIYLESKWFYYFLLFMGISVWVNMKLTAGIYAGIIMIGYMGMLWMKSKIQQLRRTFIFTVAGFFLGFILIGFNPYVTNTLQKGTPFYPALGTDRLIYTLPQFPANFVGKNSFYLLWYSIFAKSDNVRGPEKKAYLKIPFTVSKDELRAFTDTNAKQGGFGPLFGGAILLSFLAIAGAFIHLFLGILKTYRANINRADEECMDDRKSNILMGIFCLGLIVITCLINPASSLARFIPQMWLFPIITVLLAYSLKRKIFRMVGTSIILILLINISLIAFTYYHYNLEITRIYHQRLGKMAAMGGDDPIKLYFGHFRTSNTLRFDQFGIIYQLVERKEECPDGQRILPNSIILQCGGTK